MDTTCGGLVFYYLCGNRIPNHWIVEAWDILHYHCAAEGKTSLESIVKLDLVSILDVLNEPQILIPPQWDWTVMEYPASLCKHTYAFTHSPIIAFRLVIKDFIPVFSPLLATVRPQMALGKSSTDVTCQLYAFLCFYVLVCCCEPPAMASCLFWQGLGNSPDGWPRSTCQEKRGMIKCSVHLQTHLHVHLSRRKELYGLFLIWPQIFHIQQIFFVVQQFTKS